MDIRDYNAMNEDAQGNGVLPCVSDSTLLDGWMDWNTLSLEQIVEYLRKKYMFSSSGDAKCIYHLIEFYDKHKTHRLV